MGISSTGSLVVGMLLGYGFATWSTACGAAALVLLLIEGLWLEPKRQMTDKESNHG